MVFGGSQILTKGDHIHIDFPKILHGLKNLFFCLTESQHDACFCVQSWLAVFGVFQRGKALSIPRSRITNKLLQPFDRFDVVRIHIEAGCRQRLDRIQISLKVGHQAFNQEFGLFVLEQFHRVCKMLGPTVFNIIAIDACQNDVIDSPLCHRVRRRKGFKGIGRWWLGVRFNGTKHASSCAGVSQKHNGSGTARPAFTNVGALSFLANRV
mmetsp:Transcript_8133/g.19991  ORF Transcript_8133/g.19991 Transcript_8133/m.19991 type:complete len:210 (-) Transcript_8133:259-888(-)